VSSEVSDVNKVVYPAIQDTWLQPIPLRDGALLRFLHPLIHHRERAKTHHFRQYPDGQIREAIVVFLEVLNEPLFRPQGLFSSFRQPFVVQWSNCVRAFALPAVRRHRKTLPECGRRHRVFCRIRRRCSHGDRLRRFLALQLSRSRIARSNW
jgi:hypothetical protein